MNLLINIVAKLNEQNSVPDYYKKNNPGFRGNTALDMIFADMDKGNAADHSSQTRALVEKVNKLLFVPGQGETENFVTRVHGYVKIIEQSLAVFQDSGTSKSNQAENSVRRQSAAN